MLRAALTGYATVKAYVEAQEWKKPRNGIECITLARALDCMIEEFGVRGVLESQAMEVLIRRLGAVSIADGSSSWEVADELCVERRGLIDSRLQNRLQKKVKARRAMKEKPPGAPVRAEKNGGNSQ